MVLMLRAEGWSQVNYGRGRNGEKEKHGKKVPKEEGISCSCGAGKGATQLEQVEPGSPWDPEVSPLLKMSIMNYFSKFAFLYLGIFWVVIWLELTTKKLKRSLSHFCVCVCGLMIYNSEPLICISQNFNYPCLVK